MFFPGWSQGGHDACHGDSGGPLVANLPGKFHVMKLNEIENRSRNTHLKELLHPEGSAESRNDISNDTDDENILQGRMYWCAGNFI